MLQHPQVVDPKLDFARTWEGALRIRYGSFGILALGGCASSQLNYNTLDIAGRSQDLLTKQIVYNLSNYVANDLAVPAQINVDSGTASTSYQAQPSLTFPVSAMSAIAGGFSTSMGGSVSRTTTITKNGAGGGLSRTANWNQNYIFETVTDEERFLRLNALYRFASGEANSLTDYPPIHKTITTSRTTCVGFVDGEELPLAGGSNITRPKKCVSNLSLAPQDSSQLRDSKDPLKLKTTASINGDTTQSADQVADTYFTRGPGCVLCKLRDNSWLHWTVDRTSTGRDRLHAVHADDIPLGEDNGVKLFVARGQSEAFRDFEAAVLWAVNTETQSNAGSGGGGGGGGQGNSSSKSSTKSPPVSIQLNAQ